MMSFVQQESVQPLALAIKDTSKSDFVKILLVESGKVHTKKAEGKERRKEYMDIAKKTLKYSLEKALIEDDE